MKVAYFRRISLKMLFIVMQIETFVLKSSVPS